MAVLYEGTVTARALNVRLKPSLTGKKWPYGTLKKGARVQVLDAVGSWLYVDYKGKNGYVSGAYIQPVQQAQPSQTAQPGQPKYADDTKYKNFYGRFQVPDIGIDVAVYEGNAQSIVDRSDSAAIFTVSGHDGVTIADHKTQDFKPLQKCKKGMQARILRKDGSEIRLVAVRGFTGHNTGKGLTDSSYNPIRGDIEYLCYTCRNNWKNVLIVQWATV